MFKKDHIIRFIETEMRTNEEMFKREEISLVEYIARKELLEKLTAKHYKESKEKRVKKTA
jgi:hypothetical protein